VNFDDHLIRNTTSLILAAARRFCAVFGRFEDALHTVGVGGREQCQVCLGPILDAG
jgi:hypothetical protein